jgi:hypothetical protein
VTPSLATADTLTQLRKLIASDGVHFAKASNNAFELTSAELTAPKTLVDILGEAPGSGAMQLGLWLANKALRARSELVVIDPVGEFYAPAAIAWGVDAKRLLIVRPRSAREALACTEIALRSPAVGAVCASLGRIDDRAYRRLLLAAEAGNALGVFVRSIRYEADPSWADVQLRADPVPSPGEHNAAFAVRVTRRRNRHGPAGGTGEVSMDWRTGDICNVTHSDANAITNALPMAAGLARAAKPA